MRWVSLTAVVVGVGLVAFTSGSEAQVLTAVEKSYQCAKQSAIASVELSAEVNKKAQLASEIAASASACTAVQGGNPAYYVAATGAIAAVKAISPESIPTGKCASSVKGLVSRPFVEGVSYLLPPSDLRNSVTGLLKSEMVQTELWNSVNSIPGVQPFTLQVDCACTTIDNGIALTDLDTISESISRVSSSCASALDELGLGFVNDLDNVVAETFETAYDELSGSLDEIVKGESDPKSPALVYYDYYGKHFSAAVRHGASRQAGQWLSVSDPTYASKMADNFECRKYYDEHKHAYSTAVKICDDMNSRFSAMVSAMVAANIQKTADMRKLSEELDNWLAANLAWRIPLSPGSYSIPEMKAKLGKLTCSGEDLNFDRLWNCDATGIYKAVNEARAAGADSAVSLKVAFAAANPKLGGQVLSFWESKKALIRATYFEKWYKPNLAGLNHCGLAAEPFGAACLSQMEAFYDSDCHIPMAVAAYEGVSFARLNVAINACRSGLDRIRSDAGKIANRSAIADFAATQSSLCGGYTSSRETYASCLSLVNDAATDCQKQAMAVVGKTSWPQTLNACWTAKKTGLSANIGRMLAVRAGPSVNPTTSPPIGPIKTPGTSPPVKPR